MSLLCRCLTDLIKNRLTTHPYFHMYVYIGTKCPPTSRKRRKYDPCFIGMAFTSCMCAYAAVHRILNIYFLKLNNLRSCLPERHQGRNKEINTNIDA